MHVFDNDLRMVPEKAGGHTLVLSDRWAINNTANGGYIMALLTRAMGADLPGNNTGDSQGVAGGIKNTAAIITANYMDRCLHCPTRIQVSTLGESTHFIRKQASIVQDGRERIRAMGTFVRPSQIDFPSDYDGVPEDVAPWDRCIKVPSMPGYSLFDQVDLRLDPEYAGWMEGNLAQRSVMKGWVRFKDPRAVDLEALTLFADSFPPCVLARHGLVAWVPTIEYSVNIRELPSSDRLKGIFTTRFISSGLVEEDGELWDENGRLVALSRQIAKFHPQ